MRSSANRSSFESLVLGASAPTLPVSRERSNDAHLPRERSQRFMLFNNKYLAGAVTRHPVA